MSWIIGHPIWYNMMYRFGSNITPRVVFENECIFLKNRFINNDFIMNIYNLLGKYWWRRYDIRYQKVQSGYWNKLFWFSCLEIKWYVTSISEPSSKSNMTRIFQWFPLYNWRIYFYTRLVFLCCSIFCSIEWTAMDMTNTTNGCIIVPPVWIRKHRNTTVSEMTLIFNVRYRVNYLFISLQQQFLALSKVFLNVIKHV